MEDNPGASGSLAEGMDDTIYGFGALSDAALREALSSTKFTGTVICPVLVNALEQPYAASLPHTEIQALVGTRRLQVTAP